MNTVPMKSSVGSSCDTNPTHFMSRSGIRILVSSGRNSDAPPPRQAYFNTTIKLYPKFLFEVWLDPGMSDVGAASEPLKPFDARLMRCFPVSTRINHVANDDEECSAPVEPVETQNTLF